MPPTTITRPVQPSTTTTTTTPPPASSRCEGPKHRTPPGHRVLHLVIPDETFTLLHRAAIESRPSMRFSHFMRRFLKEAFPYDQPEHPHPATAIPDPTE